MTQPRLRELVKAANPVPTPARLLPQDEDISILFEEVMSRARNPQTSTGLLDATVERRRNMDTEKQTLRVAGTPEPAPKRRWNQVLVGAAALAVVVAVGAAILLASRGGDDVANGAPVTPLEVGEALNEATVTGDVEAIRVLYTDDATITDVGGNWSDRLLEPALGPFLSDLDGDGALTLFDEILWYATSNYVAGVPLAYTCTQIDSTTVVCEEVVEGHAFLSDGARSTLQASNTFTVVDGHITHQRFDGSPEYLGAWQDSKFDQDLVFEYRDWVVTKVGLAQRDLFHGGYPSVTPDIVERQRELIAEWVAQR